MTQREMETMNKDIDNSNIMIVSIYYIEERRQNQRWWVEFDYGDRKDRSIQFIRSCNHASFL